MSYSLGKRLSFKQSFHWLSIIVVVLLARSTGRCADSVDVTFRYSSSATSVTLPGEFNGWNSSAWPMTKTGTNQWIRTVRLRIGGNPNPPSNGVPGAWQFKFYTGAIPWPNDPLDHHVNHNDNDNSFIYTKDPTIYQLLPNQRNPLVQTNTPLISAYIYPKVGSVVDTAALSLTIDGTSYTNIGTHYDFATQQFTFVSNPLPNGSHTAILFAGTNSDTVTFTTQGGFVRLLNEFPFTTWKLSWILNGTVDDTNATMAKIVRNTADTFAVTVIKGSFSDSIPLVEGANVFVAVADSAGSLARSSRVTILRRVNHTPLAAISFRMIDTNLVVASAGGSTDPDSGQTALLHYLWYADSTNPSIISGVNGSTSLDFSFRLPISPGTYFFTLTATDPDNNSDTTRNYFTVNQDSTITLSTIATNPDWAQRARVYFVLPKAFSSAGTINAVAQKLQYIKDMGFNVIWLTPVMKNAYPIDNWYGIGYNIIDYYTVAPEYGTNQDLKNFVAQAHSLGLKVILDITPNHSSRFHPWSADAHTFGVNSPYWNWYEHHEITSNTNGLGDCLDNSSFNYYCGFSDQLLNLNWTDVDLRNEMINVFKFWIKTCDIDGNRFDVYWGPHRRYGEQFMGKPVRDALKHIKPDILLLAEDDATGQGTETIFADYLAGGINGGVDAAYDFGLYFGQIRNFDFTSAGIDNLHDAISNAGYYPGPDALFMRFMESQDEDRIVYFYSNNFTLNTTTTFQRTMPMASVMFTAPGFPMLYNGQEVGWGYGITGAKEARNRSVIGWNYEGRGLLAPHYQKLANIRAQFPAFTQHKRDTNHDGQVNGSDSSDFVRVASSNNVVYAFARPYTNQNGLTVVNFSGSDQTATLNLLSSTTLKFTGGVQPGAMYYLNNLYMNSHQRLPGSELDSVNVSLPAYGTAIYTVSTTPDSVVITNPITDVRTTSLIPAQFGLSQNYPNPFNPTTTIEYSIPTAGWVTLKVFNLLGEEVATLVNDTERPGRYAATWNAEEMPSGVYFYRLLTPSFVSVKKMMLVR